MGINNYNQSKRIFSIFSLLAESRGPKTIPEIIEGLSVYGMYPDDKGMTSRNIQRDIRFLRKEMKLGVLNIPGKGYLLDSGHNPLLNLVISPVEVQALYILSESLLPSLKGTYMDKALGRLVNKLVTAYFRKNPVPGQTLLGFEELVTAENPALESAAVADRVLITCLNAVKDKIRLEFRYQKVTIKAVPLKLLLAERKVYLVCDMGRGMEQRIDMTKISAVSISKQKPKDPIHSFKVTH